MIFIKQLNFIVKQNWREISIPANLFSIIATGAKPGLSLLFEYELAKKPPDAKSHCNQNEDLNREGNDSTQDVWLLRAITALRTVFGIAIGIDHLVMWAIHHPHPEPRAVHNSTIVIAVTTTVVIIMIHGNWTAISTVVSTI